MKNNEEIKNIYQYVSTGLMILLICFLTLGTISIIRDNIDYLSFSKGMSCFGFFSFVLYIIYKVINKEGIKFKDYIVILLSILGFLSYKLALDPQMALEGTFGRNEGLRVILSYYMFFLLSSTLTKESQKRVIYALLVTGIIQIIIGTFQTLRITNILGYDRSLNFSTNYKFASGTFGNPNLYSTYIILGFMICYGRLIKEKEMKSIIVNSILTLIFTYGLIIGNTTGCFLAAGIVILVTLGMKINKNNYKKVLMFLLAFIPIALGSILIFDNFVNHRITYTMNKNIEEIKDIFKNGISDSTGNNRVYIWKETLKKVPEYYYAGIGIDNFSLINDGTYLCAEANGKTECFDKAHNEFIQILITEGVFALVAYLSLLGYTVYIYFKNKNYKDNHNYVIFIAFITYLIQAQFNISVITVAPVFYMFLGYLNSFELVLEEPKNKREKKAKKKSK